MFDLKTSVHQLEDSILIISGPALAVSGIIAGVDLLTGGHAMQNVSWLALVWAICLLLTLDFQVLTLGVRAKRIYRESGKSRRRKIGEIVLAVVVAAAISYVSIQMQSIIARVNMTGLSIDQATTQLGINPIALTWERSSLVLILIFLSGWFRDHENEQNPQEQNTIHDDAIKQLTEQVSLLVVNMGQITATVTEVKTTVTEITSASLPALPMRTEQREPLDIIESEPVRKAVQNPQEANPANKKEQVRQYLIANPQASISEIMEHANVTKSYASTVRSQLKESGGH